MKLLYVGFRYHTNQVPVMKGWSERGDEVHFFAQFEGVTEVHDYVNFHLMKPTKATLRRYAQIDQAYPADEAESRKIRAFMPDFLWVYREVKKIMPDIVILREYAKPNSVVVLVCRLLGIKTIVMYVQTELYGKGERYGIGKSLFRTLLFPKACFTPVLYRGTFRQKQLPEHFPGAPRWFVPLVCEESRDEDREYCRDGVVHILDVGKYREYKNHFFFVDAIGAMEHRDRVKVTIVGQLANDAEKEYFSKLKEYVAEKKLDQVIELRGNIPFYEMQKLYSQQDVLALASTLETAGMVILESMAMGLCVACSYYCGLGSYLDEYDCGYTFDLDKPERLSVILDDLVQNPEKISTAGRKARQAVAEHFSFREYLGRLNELTKAEYGFDIEQK